MTNRRSLILLSGGIDSYVALKLEKEAKKECITLSFSYKNQSPSELRAIQEICNREKLPNYLIANSLINRKNKGEKKDPFIPDNLLYYTIAICFARENRIERIVGGQNKGDFSFVPESERNFYQNINEFIKKTYTSYNIQIFQPLLELTKLEVVKKGLELRMPLEITWSCQSKKKHPCGICSSCKERKRIAKKLMIKL
ncbi:MAG: 7-cyano-7-deazaguanine synthase [archaeon]